MTTTTTLRVPTKGVAWQPEDFDAIGVQGADTLDQAAALILRDLPTEEALAFVHEIPPEDAGDEIDVTTFAGVRAALDLLDAPAVWVVPARVFNEERWDMSHVTGGYELDHRPGRGYVKVFWWQL